MTAWILGLSIALQLVTAAVALWTLKVSRSRMAWILISAAFVLMVMRRMVGMAGWLSDSGWTTFMESIALVISILMLCGVILMRRLFLKMQACLHRQQQQIEIIEQTSDVIGTMNTRYGITYLNKAGRTFFGIKEDVPVDRLHVQDFHPIDAMDKLTREALPAAIANGCWSGENWVRRMDDGKLIPVSQVVLAHPSVDGKIAYFSTLIRDISEHKAMQKRSEELVEARQNLLAILAHDLRGPINSTLQLLTMVRAEAATTSQEELDKQLIMIEVSLRETLQILENLLHWTRSQFDTLKLQPEHVEMAAVVRSVIRQVRLFADQRGVTLSTDLTAEIVAMADPRILEITLRNLLGNAIKFSDEGSKVSIGVRQISDLVEVVVIDRGSGMPPQTLAAIQSGEPVAGRKGPQGDMGAGLGLGLCKRFLEMHRSLHPEAGMSVQSEVNIGTTVTLQLPRADN